ncbi:MAG TPA: sterol desaturase family protein [Chitinophagales bacterium]|nr:sterol desaturase family protein [Chitinophagales bacterium]HMV02237.1 sterol desaturase family protein [Chitinophagales bacterium]HMW93310.1 sterol desaturase family protein [Chitinophagales bacterium]HMY41564.1 sterol desaturase family protein [Chitinophagales bacterium]HNB37647.1 sterol desaturase family protein [Chitinophagales bacterium]
MLGFIPGLIFANAFEWYFHKEILHGQGKKKGNFWRFHWAVHHKTVLDENYRDSDYEKDIIESWNPQSKEVASLAVAAVAVAPFFPIAPGFVSALWLSQYNYYRVHKKSHLDPEWGYKYLPWHYDHHMAPNQDMNWCVTFPLWDYVMGTRLVYKGTEREQLDNQRRARKMQLKQEKLNKLKNINPDNLNISLN